MPHTQSAIKRIDEGPRDEAHGAVDEFAWQPATSRSGGIAAVNEKGRKVYGAQAKRVLSAAATKAKKIKPKSATYTPTSADSTALQSSQAIISKIKSGKLGYPELVQHIQQTSKLSTPALIHHAKSLGSKERIATRDTALKAIHDLIRSHRPKESPIRYAEETPVANCDCSLGEPNLVEIPEVEIFATGEHREKPFTHADLDQVVQNFNLLSKGPSASLRCPVVIGHEEDQAWLKDTGLPSAGTVIDCWTNKRTCPTCGGKGIATVDGKPGEKCVTCIGTGKQGVLWGKFAEVPSLIAKLVKQRAYRTVSSELYDNYHDQGKDYGVALRRVALLGGELPQVKSLADLPKLAEFSESRGKTRVVRHVMKFCDGKEDCGCGCKKSVEKFCQQGQNAGKPGPCPSQGVSKTIHTAYKRPASPEVIRHRPYESYTPAKEPAIHHRPGEANAFGKEEIRPQATGGDLEKLLRATGQAGMGIGKLGLGAGKLAAKGLWGLTKHVLWPVAKSGYRLGKKSLGFNELKAMSDVIRMAEGELAKCEEREPRVFSDDEIKRVGTAFIRKFCDDDRVRKFCQTGQNRGKPGPCPGEGSATASPPKKGRVRRAAAAMKRGAAKAGGLAVKGAKMAKDKLIGKDMEEAKRNAKDLGVYMVTGGWDPAFSRKLKNKYGSIAAALGGAAYHGVNLLSKGVTVPLALSGFGLPASIATGMTIRETAKPIIDATVGSVSRNIAKIRKTIGKGTAQFAKAMNVPNPERVGKMVRVGMKRLAKPIGDALDTAGDAAYKTASKVAQGVASAGKEIMRNYRRVPPVMRGFSESEKRLLRKVRQVFYEFEHHDAIKEDRAVRTFSDAQLCHVFHVLTA